MTSRRPPKTGLQAPRNHQGHGASFKRSFETLQGSPKDVSVVANASRQIFGAHSQKTETAAIPEHLKTFREHCENPGHKSLGLPGPTVLGRGQRANDPPRGRRVTEMNVKTHKEQSGTGGH
ncbi:hypothetical protein CRG98_023837 [Punica granatum]|uniref:Uncharacterized protein n=1 Tax=Punica granatum TaxID=22663 RepID=A0A2I0JHM8_PUNGR|nr:hypothetical protein CRG98_023837 [Punica granatum]